MTSVWAAIVGSLAAEGNLEERVSCGAEWSRWPFGFKGVDIESHIIVINTGVFSVTINCVPAIGDSGTGYAVPMVKDAFSAYNHHG